ncbi:TPA: D-Ala-D-Ala carboxypeptidase family metallohydrolase [Enterobacter cancerogenus]|nr:serine/threonine protein kinase [Enterobacter chengduensis]
MGNLSEHFNRQEFACRCGCGFDAISSELVTLLEAARAHFNSPVRINCGCRCASHNADVGGAPGSQHLSGTAADIAIAGVAPGLAYRWFDERYPNALGLGQYHTFIHVDVRPQRARWTGK